MTETELEVREAVQAAEAPAGAPPLAEAERRVDRVAVIKPSTGWPTIDLRELWHYRELLGILVWRDVKVRYKQTLIGVAWAVLQPFMTMVVFTVIFGKFAKFPSDDLPYPIFVYSGLLPWTYFASSLTQSSSSLVANATLVTKVYFPRVLLPLAAVSVPVVDFLLALVVLVGMIFYFGVPLGSAVALAPLFLLLGLATVLGVGFWLSALNVRYRDVPYAIPFLVQIWLFLSPVIYPAGALPEHWKWLFSLNPMNAVISGFRWAVLDTPAPDVRQLVLGCLAATIFLVSGLAFFKRSEPRFADTI